MALRSAGAAAAAVGNVGVQLGKDARHRSEVVLEADRRGEPARIDTEHVVDELDAAFELQGVAPADEMLDASEAVAES